MKKVIVMTALLLFFAGAAGANEMFPLEVKDSTTVKHQMTQEEILLSLQKQMTDIQLQLDQIQYSLSDSAKAKKDIIPLKSEGKKSKFYWSLRLGFLLSSTQYTESSETKFKPGVKASYVLKPAFGYIFNDRLTVGTTIVFADCRFADLNINSFQYLIANALVGGGFSLSDYMTWSIQPYVRYRFCNLIWQKLNLWGEFTVYAGQKIPRDLETHKLNTANISTIYGYYFKTAKNAMVKDFYKLHGFECIEMSEESSRWMISVDDYENRNKVISVIEE